MQPQCHTKADYSPLYDGKRFSRKAAIPSRASQVGTMRAKAASSVANPSSIEASIPRWMAVSAAASVSGGFVASSAARARAASRSASLGPKEQREVAALRHARYFAQVLGSAGDLFQTGGDALQESLALFDRERTKRNCRAALGGSRDRRLDRARAIGLAVHRCGEPRPEFTAPPA